MTGKLFIEQLKQSWLSIFTWGIGLGFLTFFMGAVVEDPEVIESYSALLESFPPAILSAFGLSDAAVLTTPEGFMVFAGFTYGSIILSVFSVLAGLNVTANDEDSGMMNVVLALPTPRWQVIIERFLAQVVILIGIVLLLFAGIVMASIIFNLEINLATMFAGSMNLIPTMLSIMGVTTLIGAVFSNKVIVTALSAGFVIVSYVVNTIMGAVDTSEVPFGTIIEKLSVYNYLDSEGVVLSRGLQMSNITVLLAITLVAVVISVYAFENRDIRG